MARYTDIQVGDRVRARKDYYLLVEGREYVVQSKNHGFVEVGTKPDGWSAERFDIIERASSDKTEVEVAISACEAALAKVKSLISL